jgi:hypothetical protein
MQYLISKVLGSNIKDVATLTPSKKMFFALA